MLLQVNVYFIRKQILKLIKSYCINIKLMNNIH